MPAKQAEVDETKVPEQVEGGTITKAQDEDAARDGESAPAAVRGQAAPATPVEGVDTKDSKNRAAADYNVDKGAAAGGMVAPVFESAGPDDLVGRDGPVDQNGNPV